MPRVEVDVYLDDFDTSELIDELESRGYRICETGPDEGFTREQILYIMEMLRKNTDLVRDSTARDLYTDLRSML